MNNIFENAKFGDKFMTRDGRIALLIIVYGKECSHPAHLYIEGEVDCREYKLDGTQPTNLKTGLHFLEENGADIVSRYQEPIKEVDDVSIYKWLRNKTACGLADAKLYLNHLIKVISQSPIYRTDSTLSLVYREPINEDKLDELAREYDKQSYHHIDVDAGIDITYHKTSAYKAGYRKAKEEQLC